jgi:hypothetical protein
LRILEIGEFSLFKVAMPQDTTFVFTGVNRRAADHIEHEPFGPAMLPGLLRSLRRGEWDIVVCFPPARPLLDCRRNVAGLAVALYRLLFRFRTLGTYFAQARARVPLVVLDYNDMQTVPRSALKLLDRSVAYFKRELPLDPGKALFDVTPAFRTHRRLMESKYFRRNIDKLRPIGLAIAEDTVREALATQPEKSVDIFFAGSVDHSAIRQRGFAQLKALAAQGYSVDICPGGLSRSEYLQRCARAWLTWSPEGYGWDCFRHYEAGLCLSVPVISPPNVTRYQPFVDGTHAFFYPVEGDGLRTIVTRALQNKAQLTAMAQAARKHVIGHNTHARICEHILEAALPRAGQAGLDRDTL